MLYWVERLLRGEGDRREAQRALYELEDVYLALHRFIKRIERERGVWLADHEPRRHPSVPGGTRDPGPLPEQREPEDPRCKADRTSTPWYACRDAKDKAGCWKQWLEGWDPISVATGGRCEESEGPAGGKTIKCQSDAEARAEELQRCLEESDDPVACARQAAEAAEEGEEEERYREPPQMSGTGFGSKQKIPVSVIDVTPLGDVLFGLCTRGGCPDPIPES